jgi:hypothetical protein
MESTVVRGQTAKQSKERIRSVDKKPMALKPPLAVAALLPELANLKCQTHSFFVNERGLCGTGLNPKLSADMVVVIADKVEEIWGKCSAFKTTMTLSPETRKELLHLYSKIYGKVEVTNNEFMAWVVKGYIAEQMGLSVNWASAAASTSFTLASRLEGELLKRDLASEDE